MLDEIDSLAKTTKQLPMDDSEAVDYGDAKAMLAEFAAKTQDSKHDDDDLDLDALCDKLRIMLSPARKPAPQGLPPYYQGHACRWQREPRRAS
jgi:hypothetical protein